MPDGTAPTIAIRPLRADEVTEMVAMFAAVADEGRWIGTEGGFDRTQRAESVRDAIAHPDERRSLAVVDLDRGAVIGSGFAGLEPFGVVDIGMALADGYREQGIGGQLLDALIEEARDLGAHKVALQVWPHNVRAIALYRSRGFVEEGRLQRHYRRTNGELWDAVVMGLVLDHSAPGSPHDDGPAAG